MGGEGGDQEREKRRTVEDDDVAGLGVDLLGGEDLRGVGGLVRADLDGDAVCGDEGQDGGELLETSEGEQGGHAWWARGTRTEAARTATGRMAWDDGEGEEEGVAEDG